MIYEYKTGNIDFDKILTDLKKDQQRRVRTKNVNILEAYQDKYWKKFKSDQQRLLWSTKSNMTCGFNVSHQLIDFKRVKSFIDVGCGTGNYFQDVLSRYQINKVVGVDAVSNFISVSKEKNKQHDINYINENIFNLNDIGKYDLCTFNGVLQTLDLSSISDVFQVLNNLVSENGQLWITTLNYYKIMKHYWSSDHRRFVGLWKYKFEEMIYHMKDEFDDIRYGFYNPDAVLMEDKNEADFVFVYGTKKKEGVIV